MKKASLVRALRLPLLVALAFNVAAVLVMPLYRARLAADRAELLAKPADAFDSLPVSLPPSLDNPQQTADSLQPSSSTPGDTQAAPTETQGTLEDDLEPASREDLTPDRSENAQPVSHEEPVPDRHGNLEPDLQPDIDPITGTERQAMSGEARRDESAAVLRATAKPLAAVGQTLAQLDHRSGTLGRPVAHAAGRLTQWLAEVNVASEAPAASTADATAAAPLGSAPDIGQPTEPEDAAPSRIVFLNPRQNGYPVAFLVDERLRSLAPGQEVIIPATEVTVRFDRGRSYGEARRTLNPGRYHFVVGPDGWKLQPQDGPDRSPSRPARP